MKYTAVRAKELIFEIPFGVNENLRIFWINLSQDSRAEFSASIKEVKEDHAIVPLIIREAGFFSANAVLSDVNRILDINRKEFDFLQNSKIKKVTLLLLAKDDFRLPQISSPIILPDWLFILGPRETSFRIADLAHSAESDLLNCPESRVADISSLLYELEREIIFRLQKVEDSFASKFVAQLLGISIEKIDSSFYIGEFLKNINDVDDSRAYRPSAAEKINSVSSKIIRLCIRSSPKELALHARILAEGMVDESMTKIKPTIFSVMLRPTEKLNSATRNWHAILTSVYQAYQVMNGAAHAGEYEPYPVNLIYSSSVDLRRFLSEARIYIEDLV